MSAEKLSRDLIRLTNLMHRLKKSSGTAPFILVLGADAAPISIGDLEEEILMQDGLTGHKIHSMEPNERTDEFKDAWEQLGMDLRFASLEDVYNRAMDDPQRAHKLEQGYKGLARLIKAGYFDIVLTTNVDTLLEDALIEAGLTRRHWQLFINGRDRLDKIIVGLDHPIPRVKIVKLHGDLYSRSFAFSHKEVFRFSREIESLLEDYLARAVLIMGHSMRDMDINRCMPSQGDNLYYVNVTPPQMGTNIGNAIRVRRSVTISGEEADFGFFFPTLSRKLLGGDKPEEVGLETLDEVGVEVSRMPDEKIESAMASDKLVGLVEPIGDLEIVKPTAFVPDGPLVNVLRPTALHIRYDNDQRLSFAIEGALSYESKQSEQVHLETEGLNRTLQFMGRDIATYHRAGDKEGRDSWRERAKREGGLLYKELFAENADLLQKFGMARQAVGQEEDLYLCFAGPRNHLGMPYELLCEIEPFAVRYPICRQVTGVPSRAQSFDELLAELRRENKPLRILLIASDTGGINSDGEVQMLARKLQEKTDTLKIKAEIERIPTEKASLRAVDRLLNKCSYHIVHYAGHGFFDEATGEESGLIFWKKENKQGGTDRLTARALAQRLRNSQTRLFYLSSCVGATVGGEHLLHSNDYLGVMDAVVQAGVPIVLGYRWYVTDSSARTFASLFYQSLFETQSPARAALNARREIYIDDATNETWTSPILVVQKL